MRRLINFYKEKCEDNVEKWYISFAYYDDKDELIPSLSEHTYISDDRLHKLLRKELILDT